MVKICHMTSGHDSDDVRIFQKECVSLASAGYDVYLVAQGKSREDRGVHVIGLNEPAPESRTKRLTEFARKIYEKALEIDADIYHFHDPELLPYGLKLKKRGKKVIFDSHENYPAQLGQREYIPKFFRSSVSGIYKAVESHCVKGLDAVIVPCTFDDKNIFEGRVKKVCFIANYPKLSDFYYNYNPEIKGEGRVCYVGSLSYERGIYHLTKAVRMAGKKLVLAGPFSSHEFENKLRAMEEFSCVDYMGTVPNDRVSELLQTCSIGANTLLNTGQYHHMDTFGIKVFEYMSMAMPVLLPDYPYMRKMCDKYGFGICVKTDDPSNIAQAITYLSDNPDICAQMGACGREAVEKEFNWGTQEKKLLELYSELSR